MDLLVTASNTIYVISAYLIVQFLYVFNLGDGRTRRSDLPKVLLYLGCFLLLLFSWVRYTYYLASLQNDLLLFLVLLSFLGGIYSYYRIKRKEKNC